MKTERRTYTRQFKVEVVHLLETTGKSAHALERQLGIGKGCILRWKRELKNDAEGAFPGQGHLSPEPQRLHELERVNAILRQERDILKKAVPIFSRPSK